MAIKIAIFNVSDQAAVKALILDGLAGYFGEIYPSLNPDLDDIAASYAGAVFLVARRDGGAASGSAIAGCGALVPLDGETGEIVRMSVAADARRQGVGTQILDTLTAAARELGLKRLVLETTVDWQAARRFYERCGFPFMHEQDHRHGRQAHYELILDQS